MAQRALYEGRIHDYVWLEVDDIVVRWRATLYSSDNAVANRAVVNEDPRTALDSESIQAEVLVLGGLNVKWITFPASIETRAGNVRTCAAGGLNIDVPF